MNYPWITSRNTILHDVTVKTWSISRNTQILAVLHEYLMQRKLR